MKDEIKILSSDLPFQAMNDEYPKSTPISSTVTKLQLVLSSNCMSPKI